MIDKFEKEKEIKELHYKNQIMIEEIEQIKKNQKQMKLQNENQKMKEEMEKMKLQYENKKMKE